MSTKITKRREARNAGTSRQDMSRVHVDLDMQAWRVTDHNGIANIVYTLGGVPEGYTNVTAISDSE